MRANMPLARIFVFCRVDRYKGNLLKSKVPPWLLYFREANMS